MPNEAISGVLGNVTFASGFAVNDFAWEAVISGVIAETTAFTPTNNYRTRATTGLSGWRGSYRCRQPITATASISGPSYIANPFAFTVRSICTELEVTKFGDAWRNYIAGLLDTEGEFQVYIEETAALPVPLTTATGLFTVDTGLTISVPLIIGEEINVGVSVDGESRVARIPFKGTGAPTIVGCPTPGATGSATFLAHTGRSYSGTILVTRAEITANRDNSNSEWKIDWVGCGTCTAA